MGIRVWLPRRGRQSNPNVGRGDLLMSGVHTLRGPALFCLPALLVLILVTGMAGPQAAEAQAPTAPAQQHSPQHQAGGEPNPKIPNPPHVSFWGVEAHVLPQCGPLVSLSALPTATLRT